MKLFCLPLTTPKHQKGFSLLEALIASVIFAAVLLIASSAFKFFMSMGERKINSEKVMKDMMTSLKLRNSIKGLHHYYLRESAISLDEAKPFFLGELEGFTGISLNTLDFVHQPARITVSTKKDKQNHTHLVYCEYDNNLEYPKLTISAECEQPRVVVANINKVKFEYFGWTSLDVLYGMITTPTGSFIDKKNWTTLWSGRNTGLLPQYIRVSIDYNGEEKPYQAKQLWFHIADADPVQFSINSSSNESF